jgi:23S rRNA pseudouridine2605 synthase
MTERLQKVLAHAGIGSRRHCEELIRQGRVRVDGSLAKLGDKVDPEKTRITVDNKPVPFEPPKLYILLNKPSGVVASTRSYGRRKTVTELVPSDERLYPIGRLDVESEGLILLTNDGDLTYRLTHPKFGHEKEYRVQVDRMPSEDELARWRHGLRVDGIGMTAPARVTVEREDQDVWLRVTMHEGKKRQIRATAAQFGLSVVRLIRIRMGTLSLGDLPPGGWRRLETDEVDRLKTSVAEQK